MVVIGPVLVFNSSITEQAAAVASTMTVRVRLALMDMTAAMGTANGVGGEQLYHSPHYCDGQLVDWK